jgi:hypothetical protein
MLLTPENHTIWLNYTIFEGILGGFTLILTFLGENQEVYYANCTAVRNAGKAPIHKGDPGYSFSLDRDKDGVACE